MHPLTRKPDETHLRESKPPAFTNEFPVLTMLRNRRETVAKGRETPVGFAGFCQCFAAEVKATKTQQKRPSRLIRGKFCQFRGNETAMPLKTPSTSTLQTFR